MCAFAMGLVMVCRLQTFIYPNYFQHCAVVLCCAITKLCCKFALPDQATWQYRCVMIFFFNTVFSSFVQHTLEVLDKDFEDVPGFDNFKAEGKTASCLVSNI